MKRRKRSGKRPRPYCLGRKGERRGVSPPVKERTVIELIVFDLAETTVYDGDAVLRSSLKRMRLPNGSMTWTHRAS